MVSRPGEVPEGKAAMWDKVTDSEQHLSHDLPCPRCGHEVHTFLACGDDCACPPALLPGSAALQAA